MYVTHGVILDYMNKRKAFLPLSLAGPGNQYCGIKEALVMAHVLDMDIALPRIIPHGTTRSKAEFSYGFDDTFDIEKFRLNCATKLGINVVEFVPTDASINLMMRSDDASKKQALDYLELHRQALSAPEDHFKYVLETPNPRMLKSIAEIEEWGGAVSRFPGFDEAQTLSLVGIFNSIKLGGINTHSEASPCNKNHCLNCPPNQELSGIYDQVNQCFQFNRRVRDIGDDLIQRHFGDRPYVAFHLRICDVPKNRTFKECYSGYTEEEVASAVSRISSAAGVSEADVFLASPPQLFSSVSDLHLINDGQFFKTAARDVGNDPYYASLVEQYVCSKATVFIRSYTNTPDTERKRHTRSSWSELVEGIRRCDTGSQNITIDDAIHANAATASARSDKEKVVPLSSGVGAIGPLETGDYLPNIFISNDHAKLDLQSWATLEFFIICSGSGTTLAREDVPPDFAAVFVNLILINAKSCKKADAKTFYDRAIWEYLRDDEDQLRVYHVGHNLKISGVYRLTHINQLSKLTFSPLQQRQLPAPVITIPDAITQELAELLISELNAKPDSHSLRNDNYKRRSHLQTNPQLSELIDKKLVKSVFPEIEKAFYSRITHRETYKICLYDGENSGRFGKHRDTIDPYRHRRYAMTLALNDDYEGGGICFPEYSTSVVPLEKYSAVIFPGSLFHEVKPIESGKRYVVISFFFGDVEAATNDHYRRYKVNASRGIDHLSLRAITPSSMD